MVDGERLLKTLVQLRAALESREVTASSLLDSCLANASESGGEGERVFVELLASEAQVRADLMDGLRRRGTPPSPWCGIPVAVKDLFDLEGCVTRAGSRVLEGAPPALVSAPAVARLERAGFVIVGRTNMTEFAYSGVGINPHYGTPLNPFDRATGRIPGGSSSGSAVAVTDGMAAGAIGSDTGGSCRIPAALTGITGYKPTASRVPLDGVYPLSPSLDSVGPLAKGVSCCAVLDDLLAGGTGWLPATVDLKTLELAVLDHYVDEGLDTGVATAYEHAIALLSEAGAKISPVHVAEFESIPELNANGGIAAAEAFAFHEQQITEHGDEYDPRVGGRIRAGAVLGTAELAEIRRSRSAMIDAFAQAMKGYDAMLSPTVPIVAPPIAAFATDEEYVRLNRLLLRNPSLFNFLDGCAISIPVQLPDRAPVGLMLAAPGGTDRQLLTAARTIEATLAARLSA